MGNETTESLTRIKRLAAANRAISASLDFEEALRRIAESAYEVVGAASCLVLLREGEDSLRIYAAQGINPATAERFVGSMDELIFDKLQQFLGLPGLQSSAAFPIISDHVVRGILVVIRAAPLDAEETRLMSALTDLAAVKLGSIYHKETLASRERKLQGEVDRSRKGIRELEAMLESVARDLRGHLRNLAEGGQGPLDESGVQTPAISRREPLARMAWGARKAGALIGDLLAFSRLAGAELILAAVDLDGVVAEAQAEVEMEIRHRAGVIHVQSPLFKAFAHRETLVKILGNLLWNGAELVPPGEPPRLDVKAELLGDRVRISVQDNGEGIGELDLDRIFGDFERLEGRPDSRIGLAVVHRGMERMGGRCGVESKPGEGSRFWIELPRA